MLRLATQLILLLLYWRHLTCWLTVMLWGRYLLWAFLVLWCFLDDFLDHVASEPSKALAHVVRSKLHRIIVLSFFALLLYHLHLDAESGLWCGKLWSVLVTTIVTAPAVRLIRTLIWCRWNVYRIQVSLLRFLLADLGYSTTWIKQQSFDMPRHAIQKHLQLIDVLNRCTIENSWSDTQKEILKNLLGSYWLCTSMVSVSTFLINITCYVLLIYCAVSIRCLLST